MSQLPPHHDKASDFASQKMCDFHSDVVAELRVALAEHKVVVVGMALNPHVKEAQKALHGAGVEAHYLEYGSYFSQWKRLALKLFTSWPTFPQVFVHGVLIGGGKATKATVDSGAVHKMLEEAS
jgi:glutaredoxin-related protein